MRELVSIVIPAYNEQEILADFMTRLEGVLAPLDYQFEFIVVDDGSVDETSRLIRELAAADPRVHGIELSRNFGKEIAMTAGLDHARGAAAVIIDADGQDPPEVIPEFLRLWGQGHDVVYGQRISRRGESWLKRATAYGFYRVIHLVSRVKIPKDTGDFRLLSRRAIDALKQVRERHRFMKGIFAWIGFDAVAVPYEREPRGGGRTKFSYRKLFDFAIEGITSFSVAPLKVATWLGLAIAIGSFSYAIVIIFDTMIHGIDVPGYASLMVAVLFLGGIQLLAIGILGEYLGRIFNETKARPLYLVRERINLNGEPPAADRSRSGDLLHREA
ncbi:MAG: glycosyltransferase family 2 protein [Planctomycetota bacterium]|jgi:glycosyltransferase involved in cell wall biosynthesis